MESRVSGAFCFICVFIFCLPFFIFQQRWNVVNGRLFFMMVIMLMLDFWLYVEEVLCFLQVNVGEICALH